MRSGRDAIFTHRNAANSGDLGGDLGRRQHATVAGLRSLRKLQLDHLDLRIAGRFRELLGIEPPRCVTAAEIARADLPHQIATMLAVIGRHPAFAGVMEEPALLRALVHRPHGIGRQRPIAHRRDVQEAGGIELRAGRAADSDPHRIVMRCRLGGQRVMQPLVLVGIDVVLRAERPLIELFLGALIDNRPLVAGKRGAFLIGLEEILAHLGPDRFQQEPQVRGHRVVAQDGVFRLRQVAQRQCQHACADREKRKEAPAPVGTKAAEDQRQRPDHGRPGQKGKARLQGQSDDPHVSPPSTRN